MLVQPPQQDIWIEEGQIQSLRLQLHVNNWYDALRAEL